VIQPILPLHECDDPAPVESAIEPLHSVADSTAAESAADLVQSVAESVVEALQSIANSDAVADAPTETSCS
jgi:hypothetical protein